MSQNFNADLVNEINSLRTNPKRYSNKLREYTKYFKGKVLRLPGSNAGIKTEEGADAYTEAADFLVEQSRIEPFVASKGLCKIAEEFLKEVQKCDPSELGNIDMEEIIEKYGTFCGNFSRAIDFGGETPEQVLTNLIVSDGDPSRGQRESLLSTDLKSVGVANGKHDIYRHCTVIVSCTKFENTKDDDDREDFGEGGSYDEPKKKDDGKTLKPRKVVLKKENNDYNEEPENIKGAYEDEVPPGCISVNKSEKIVIEGGKKKKLIKITRVMEDGSKEIETVKESVDDE